MKNLLSILTFIPFVVTASQAVVFDYGDVLAFQKPKILNEFLCQSLEITQEQLKDAKEKKRLSRLDDAVFWIQLSHALEVPLPKNWPSLYHRALLESLGANEEMYSIAEALNKEGIKVGLLSNIEKKYALVAEKFGLFEPFYPLILACDIGCKKPASKPYELLIVSLDLPPHEIVFIDDSLENVKAAKNHGFDAFVFESPKQVKDELKKRNLLQNLE